MAATLVPVPDTETAIARIDEGINALADRSLIDTNTMTDLLLDIRSALMKESPDGYR